MGNLIDEPGVPLDAHAPIDNVAAVAGIGAATSIRSRTTRLRDGTYLRGQRLVTIPTQPGPVETGPETPSQRARSSVEQAKPWKWVLDNGADISELVGLTSRRITWRLDGQHDLAFALNGMSHLADRIIELESDVLVYRVGQTDPLVRCRVGPSDDDLDADRYSLSFTAWDYRAELRARKLYPSDQLAWPLATDVAILAACVNATQGRTAGDLGLTPGVGWSSIGAPIRSVQLRPNDSIGGLFDQFGRAEDAPFDWDIDSAKRINLYRGGRGGDANIVLDYGGTVRKVRRRLDAANYSNTIIAGGGQGAGNVVVETIGIPARIGRRERGVSYSGITDPTLLAVRANGDLQRTARPPEALTLELRNGVWDGPGTCWLGDRVPVVVRRGRLRIAAYYRVQSIAVALDENNIETVQVTVQSPDAWNGSGSGI